MPLEPDVTQALPLRWFTPDAWAVDVLRQPLALLSDHAHLERKAASNALELLSRWPDPAPPAAWVATMTSVARDEVEHLQRVTRLLESRGGTMDKLHRNPYANDLRREVRPGGGPDELVDRLLVSALIEARSCERFAVLGENCADEELGRLYRSLWASEFGHYTAFVDLARQVQRREIVDARWSQMLDAEARIAQDQPAGPRMHSGVGP